MALKGPADLPPFEIPQTQGAIVAAGDNAIPVGAKGHRPNPSFVALKGPADLPSVEIPQP